VTCQSRAGGRPLPTGRGGRFTQAQRPLLAALVLLLAGCPAVASAQEASTPTPPQVRVDCPELEADEVAAVEARQMSELLSQGVEQGTLLLVCSPDRVSGIWQERGVTVDSRYLSRNEGESAVELLHWLASVLFELRKQREAAPPAAGDPSGTAVALGGASATAPAEASASLEDPTPAPSPEQDSAQASSSAEAAPARASEAPAAPRQRPWTLSLGVAYGHFGTEIVGALGPRGAISRRIAGRLHVLAQADVKLGLGSSEGFGVVDFSAALGASCDILPFLSATLAPRLVLTAFSAPPGTTGASGPIVAGGALASVRGRIPLQILRPYLELGVEAAGPARQATLAGSPALTVPVWQALVAAGIELPF